MNRPHPVPTCADCGRPVSPGATRCRPCARLTRLRHHNIVTDCPFPPARSGERRVLTAEQRWWIRTAGGEYTSRALAQHFGVHPTTIARIRAEPSGPGRDAHDESAGRVLPWRARQHPR